MNELAPIGHNQPKIAPELQAIQDLFDEASLWLDGDKLTTKAQHDKLIELVKAIRKAKREADNARKEEAKPFDEAKAEIQARYNVFIKARTGLADMAIETAQKVLAPYLTEQQRIKDEQERIAREEAAQAQREAQEAMKASQGDLEMRALAEEKITHAKEAEKLIKDIGKQNIAKGARTVWDTELIDSTAAMRALWVANKHQFEALMLDIGKSMVRSGIREIPGFKIMSRKVI